MARATYVASFDQYNILYPVSLLMSSRLSISHQERSPNQIIYYITECVFSAESRLFFNALRGHLFELIRFGAGIKGGVECASKLIRVV